MSQNTVWQFYTSTTEAWDAMLEHIQKATISIDLEQFIFSYDSVGIRFLDTIRERARAGVRVRLFCDEVGSFSLYRSGIAPLLEKDGIELKFFNSVIPWNPNKETLWFFRDHRKLLIIDKKIGFTGGVCLGEAMSNWRESTVKIEGAVVGEMLRSFEIMWNKAYRRLKFYLNRKYGKRINEENQFNYITNSPLPRKRYMYKEIIKAIKNARHYIYLTTPYFLPDSRLLRYLKRASQKGVKVKLLLPENTNSKLVNIGSGTFFKDLMEAGVRIFRYKNVLIHSKTGVVDGEWSTIGSLNLDNLSLRYNFEGNIVTTNKDFARELERQFMDDLNKSTELTLPDWEKRGFWRKVLEKLVWPLRKLL